MFGNVFLPPYLGDYGIAIGCCAYALFGNRYDASSSTSLASSISLEDDHEDEYRDELNNANDKDKDKDADATTTAAAATTTMKGEDLPPPPPPLWYGPLSPYLGPSPINIEMAEEIKAASPWLNVKNKTDNPESSSSKIIDIIIDKMDNGGVVILYRGR